MNRIQFLLAAEQEFIETVIFYNSQSAGLGFEFAAEVRSTLARIIQYPLAWHKLSERTHRCRTNRFPYGVIYQIRKDCIMIIAIMHLHRKPETWIERIRKNKP
ncbi:MAG: type II toxin-antitoxin system RelE/ParE family toxin [Candidatus Aminicenantes bacterium]|nr:type II toxin-antitoxin system RelE/ParE family toxin [Acidobacteriota bacterium]MCG2812244.1 type II toxin-antitoxin system RelE/ParE family toxin [Candidatus Aminicenantes bacterium]